MKFSWVERSGLVRENFFFFFFEQLMTDIFKEISINSSESSF